MEEHLMVRALMSERTKVLAYIQSLVRDLDAAEDIFQDVCVLAIQKRSEIQNTPHLLNWLRTTSRFQALNLLRKRRQLQKTLSIQALDLLEADWATADADDNASINEALQKCLGRLSPAMQALVRQRYVERLDFTQLGELCGRSVNSLYVTFSRVYAALGECIAREIGSPEKSHG